jgi:hypothetical protein
MSPPQPIVEAPVIPDLPFIQKLPETRFFKENTNKDTFTIDEARAVIHGLRTVNNGGTEKTYYDKVNAILTKFNLERENGLWSDVYKKGFKTIIEVLKKKYKNPSGYIVMLLYIHGKSPKLKAIVDKYDDNLLDNLEVEYRVSK